MILNYKNINNKLKNANNWYYQIEVENRQVLLTKKVFSVIIPKQRKG